MSPEGVGKSAVPARPRTLEEPPSNGAAINPPLPSGNTQVQPEPVRIQIEEEEQFTVTNSAIPREVMRNGGPISDIPEKFKPEDPLAKTPPTRPDSFFAQLSDPAISAHELFEAIRGASGSLISSETGILNVLANKDGEQLNSLIRAYRGHYDRDILGDLRAFLKDDPRMLEGVEIIFQALRPESTSALLNLALTIPADHRELINEILGHLDPDEMIALRNDFRKKYGADIKDILTSKLAGDDLRLAVAILEKNQFDGYAVRLHEVVGLAQRDTTPLAIRPRSLSDDSEQVGFAFSRIYGGSVVELSKKTLTERQLQALEYALKGDAASAQAVLLKDALCGSGDIRILAEVLLGSDNELREEALSRFQWIFGRDFLNDLHSTQDLPNGTKLFVERISTNGDRASRLSVS